MSGLEPIVAAGGVRLLAGLAPTAAQALARKATFRRRVSRRVRKRVEWSCPWSAYRKWLKDLTVDDLATPAETIQASLASRLDAELSAASVRWPLLLDHLSRSLRLVEMTYPAIAAALGDADRAAASESWAQQRSAEVRELLLQLAGPGAALGSADLAMALERRSRARRAVRLQAFGVDEEALAAHFDSIDVLDVPDGDVKVLLGDFGSGKSEIAEVWHRACIADLAAGENARFPVWCNARDLRGQSLEEAVDQEAAPGWRQGRGASIVVDGVDESDPAAAQSLLDEARTVVRTFANVRVLMTARPGVLAPTEKEQVSAALLAEDEALRLVELAGGGVHHTWHWTANVRLTVTRPFFALATGAMLARDEAPHGEADLIRGLVEDALSKGTERAAVTSTVTWSVLMAMAVALTGTGADGLSFSDRQIARSSRLVADGARGAVRFSLPIFQHWFAAQALLSGAVPTGVVVADAPSFNRWRWAAAVAILGANSADAVDNLLGEWVTANPGAAAWVMSTAFGGHRDWRTRDDEELDANTSGERLLRALRTWADSLGDLANGTLPRPIVEGPVRLGVAVSGPRIDVAFAKSRPAADSVTELPPGVHPLFAGPSPDWMAWMSGGAPEGPAWPWTMVRSQIAGSTIDKLSLDYRLGAPAGVWVEEHRFDLARRLLNRGSLFHGTLPAAEVRERAATIFDGMGRNRNAAIVLGGGRMYDGADLESLVSWIDASAAVEVESHLPAEDVSHPMTGWVWNSYSPGRLMEFEVEVYGRACEAYDEALAHAFARLGWSMPGAALAPFGVVLRLTNDKGDGVPPGLAVTRVPMVLLPRFVDEGREVVWSRSGRSTVTRVEHGQDLAGDAHEAIPETVRAWLAEHGRESTAGLGWSHTGAVDMSNARPASSVAARWLSDDLKTLGLASGTFPQLR